MKGNDRYRQIAYVTISSNREYKWEVPLDLEPGDDYSICVSTQKENWKDCSNSFFKANFIYSFI